MLAHRAVLEAVKAARAADPDNPAGFYTTRVPDRVTRPTLVAWPVSIAREALATRARFVTSTAELWILTQHTDEAGADEALDPLVSDLVGILEATPLVHWTTLERGALEDRFHGWRATVTVAHTLT